MIAVQKETERIIKGDNRQYEASVCFNFLSCKVPESIKIKAPNAVKGCVPDQIVYPYLTHIQNRFFTHSLISSRLFPEAENIHKDGALHQVKKRAFSRVGYIGLKAGSQGKINDTVTLYIPKTNIKKITLKTNHDRIIEDALIIAKTSFGTEIARYRIQHNEKDFLILECPADNTGIIELQIKKHTPDKRVWIIAFYPGFEFSVNEKDIIKIKHQKKKTENKEGSIGRLYINSIDLELNNLTRIYDSKNTKSPIAGHFNSNAVCSAICSLKQNKSNKPFALNFGSFYIMKIQNNESSATVTIKAQDYIGVNKNKYLSLGIQEESDAYSCFAKIAGALNLSATRIDESLKKIKLKRFSLNGTVSSLLNNLCVLTNTFCSCDETGTALTAALILSRHGAIRYPVRYFLLNEFKNADSGEEGDASPNVINLSYSTYEYEGEYQAGNKDIILYTQIGKKQFPEKYKNTPYGEYPLGGGLSPSITRTYKLPHNFETIELSDPFIPKALEYSVEYEYADDGKANKAAIKVWNFITRNEGEQLSIITMIKQKPAQILLKKEEFQVPKMPRSYIKPDENENFNISDTAAVEKRNAKNTPYEFKIELKGAVTISAVEVANRFLKSKFEFSYRKTSEGIYVKAWNYFPENPQTVTVKIYGNRLIPGKEKKTITARNEDDIRTNGEIVKNIEVGALASDEVAREVLSSMAYYYRHFSKNLSVQTWADPRLTLYDLIAFKSLRGYGFTQGIIEEIELEYKGYLTQKIKIKQTKKHNRDSRLFAGAVIKDRPFACIQNTGYV